MTLCVGAISGAALALLCIWLWLIVNGNISMTAIVATIIVAVCVFVCCQVQNRVALKKAKKAYSYKLEKYQSYYYLFSSWMVLRNKGRMLAEYFENYNFQNVAIYGLGRLGFCLYEELKGSNINVKYAIDMNAASFSYLNLKVVSPEINLKRLMLLL